MLTSIAVQVLLVAQGACVDGTVVNCTLSGCLKAQKVCDLGVFSPCECLVVTCDDANPCTTDSWNGSFCAHTPNTGASCDDGNACTSPDTCNSSGVCAGTIAVGAACSDANACTTGDTCDAAGACAGGPVPTDPATALNDKDPTTYDYCDASGVHHDPGGGGTDSTGTGQPGAAPAVGPNPLAQPLSAMPTAGGPQVVENTGEVRYQYAFDLPAARGRNQPALGLTYSSASNRDEDYGYGWSLSASYVEMDLAVVPTAGGLYPPARYRLSSGGEPVLLVRLNDGTYRPEVQAGFLRLTPTAAGWTAVDSVGSTFLFETFFGGQSGVGSRWYLTSVADVDGNKTMFSYQRETGAAAVLVNVSYNNYLDSGGGEAFATAIDLAYSTAPELGPARRFDVAGSLAELKLHLRAVSVQARGYSTGGLVLLRRYDMGYRFSSAGAKSLLASIAVAAGAGGSARTLPPTTFEYEVPGEAVFALSDTYNYLGVPEGVVNDAGQTAAWIDLNGDGLADRVADGPDGLLWARNRTVPGSTTLSFDPLVPLGGSGGARVYATGPGLYPVTNAAVAVVHSRLYDVNGDGLPDLVRDSTAGSTCTIPDSDSVIEVRFAQPGSGGSVSYGQPICLNVSSVLPAYRGLFVYPPPFSLAYGPCTGLGDVNGDGVADYFVGGCYSYKTWHLGFVKTDGTWTFGPATSYWANTPPLYGNPGWVLGDGATTAAFTESPRAPRVGTITCPSDYWEPYSWNDPRAVYSRVDLNGDGIPDYVQRLSDLDGTCTLQTCSSLVWWGTSAVFARGAEIIPQPPPWAVACPPDFTFPDVSPSQATATCMHTSDLTGWMTFTSGETSFVGWEAGFVDLNGDGVADYMTARSPYATCDSSNGGAWSAYVGTLAPILLRQVTTSAGAAYAVTYERASAFGSGPRDGLRYVATSVAVSGPRMLPAASYYWYQGPTGAQLWYEPLRYEPRGFSTTWVYDDGAKLVRTATWATGSHVFKGNPTAVEWGTPSLPWAAYDPAQPPAATPFRRANFAYAARGQNASCTTGAVEPTATDYPVIPVVTSATTTNTVDSVQLVSSRSMTCANVDDYGNVLRTNIDPDAVYSGDEHYEQTTYDAAATCKSCPVKAEVWTLGGELLAQSFYRYDSPTGTWNQPLPQGSAGNGYLNYVSRWVGASNYEIGSATAYNSNGTVAWRVVDPLVGSHAYPVTESYTYDLQGLRVSRKTVGDLSVTLVSDTTYDESGRPVLAVGPYVSGSTAARPQFGYGYDVFGRVVAVGWSVSAGTVSGGVAAAEYVDSQPPVVKRYTFLAAIQFTVGQVPAISDVKQVVTHFDGLGRPVEVRERLGGGPIHYANSQLAQLLSGYRVTRSVKYDAAGRVVASLEPVYSSTGTDAYEGFEALAAGSGRRGGVSLFDAKGQLVCAKSGVYAALAGDACNSSFADSGSHVLATAYTYRGFSDSVRSYVGVTAVPPKEDSSVQGTEAAYRADGRLAGTADGYGNKVSYAYDTLGRAVAVTRQASGMAKSAQTATRRYDTVGRVVEELDDNWSPGASASRLLSYDAAGRVTRVQLAPQLFGTSWVRPELRYEHKTLGRRTRAYALEPKWVSGALSFSTREIAGYQYDTPYTSSPPYGGPPYAFTAGRLSYLTSPLTTIALGYDQYGSVLRRDQSFLGLAGAFSVLGDVTPDGRLRWSSFASGFSKTVTHTAGYDSAARPVKIALGTTALWEAVSQAGNLGGAYDALDRIHQVRSNGGTVNTVRDYSAFTGQLTAHGVATTAAQVYQVDSLLYLGTKLKSQRDALTATTYEHTYDWNSRLTKATAGTTSTSPLAQSYTEDYSFTDPSWPARATVGNLESVTSGGQTVNYDYLADRVVSRSVAPNGPAFEVMVYDHQGRLTSRRPLAGSETEGFAYDIEDQLKQVRRSGTVAEVLEYDPLGAVMFRKVGTKAYWYVGPFATVTADVSASCQGYGCSPATTPKVGVHVLLAGTRIATVRAPPSGSTADPAGDVLYYHRDLRGSVIATTLSGGRVGVKYRYGPYGDLDRQEVVDAGGESELGYTGGLRLGWTPGSQSGSLLLLGARVYHAELRRWVQADAVDNLRYAYAAGDPVNLVDPSGLRARDPLQPSFMFLDAFPWGIPDLNPPSPLSVEAMQAAMESPIDRRIREWFGESALAFFKFFESERRAEANALARGVAFAQAASGPSDIATDAPIIELPGEVVRTGRPLIDRLAEYLASVDVEGPANFMMGLGDALTFGGSRHLRNYFGLGQFARRESGAYLAGEIASLAFGGGRLAYAGAAKALPFLIRGGNTMERALAISAARNELKLLFRGGLFPESRMHAAQTVIETYGTPEAIIAAATRTNSAFNVAGVMGVAGAAYNYYGP